MERYQCPHFRILVIGRANAGKTTILEKVCGVAQGTKPIIYDQDGVVLNYDPTEPEPKRKLVAKVKHILGGKAPPTPSANVASTHTMPLTPSIEVSK
jgi:GTPase SAR1 family protein